MQAQLEVAKGRYFDLYEDAPVAYITVSQSGGILACNRAGAALFQITPESLSRRRIHDLVETAFLAEFNLDRHWRNARVHTLHDPVRWKVQAVGAYHLNGARPARHSWI